MLPRRAPRCHRRTKPGKLGLLRVASLGPLSIISCLCPVYHISPSPHKEQARGGVLVKDLFRGVVQLRVFVGGLCGLGDPRPLGSPACLNPVFHWPEPYKLHRVSVRLRVCLLGFRFGLRVFLSGLWVGVP